MNKLMQIKDYLLELSFLALLIRVVLLGAGIGESLALVSIVISMSYARYLNKSKIEDRDSLVAEINEIKNKVNSLTIERSLKPKVLLNEQETKQAPKRLF